MIKLSLSVFALLLISISGFSQENFQQQFVKMKRELNLTNAQEKEIKKIHTQTEIKTKSLNRSHFNAKEIAAKTLMAEQDEKKRILGVLNAEQQQRWEMILNNTPRRGVTGMPNE